MKPPPFDYVAAATIDHAVELLNGEAEARVIAGGQSLMPLLNLRLSSPELVVDIGRIDELQGIDVGSGSTGPVLTIGAGVTQTEVGAHAEVSAGWPLLTAAIGLIGHAQIRNRGTLCGSLAHNDPLAELPAAAIALDASVTVRGPSGERTIPVAELFAGPFMTSLEAGELIIAAHFPAVPAGTGWSIREFATRTGDFATAGAIVRLRLDDGVAADPVVVLFGLGSGPERSTVLETAIDGAASPTLSDAALAALDDSIDPTDDAHASADARRELAGQLVQQSLSEAWVRAATGTAGQQGDPR